LYGTFVSSLHQRGLISKCHSPIGVPGMKRKEEEIDIAYSDTENYKL
jgi:hypothetical protein